MDPPTTATDIPSTTTEEHNILNTSISSGENIEALQKIIEEQNTIQQNTETHDVENHESPEGIADSVMNMILTQSEENVQDTEASDAKKDSKSEEVKPSKLTITSDRGIITVAVGCKVDAQDFEGEWYPADVLEIDIEEVEVLVRYTGLKKTDEWISANSSRLRQYTGERPPKPEIKEELPEVPEIMEEPPEVVEEVKEVKPLFVEGERCLARWRDNKRFMATVTKVLDDGKFEIVFDDGFCWTCGISRLHKWKPLIKTESLSLDVSQSPSLGPNSPIYGTGPSNTVSPTTPFHTHLFDPTRDYLSSKSERREMKRKLNIKEIFNIGQKKPKVQKETKPKAPVEKKPKTVKPSKKKTVKSLIKDEAVASIIGTIKAEPTIKTEPDQETDEISTLNKTLGIKMEVDNAEENTLEQNKYEVNSESSDSVEEVLLENFDQTENDGHLQVLNQIKEAISKLESGIIEIEKPSKTSATTETPSPEIVLDNQESIPEIKEQKVKQPLQKVEEQTATVEEAISKDEEQKLIVETLESITSTKVEQFKANIEEATINTEAPVSIVEDQSIKRETPVPVVEAPITKSETPRPETTVIRPIVVIEKSKIPLETLRTHLEKPKGETELPKTEFLSYPICSNTETKIGPELDSNLNTTEEVEIQNTIETVPEEITEVVVVDPNAEKRKKVKKGKKIRILGEKKKVDKQVELVKNELEQMKRQFEEMRKQMMQTQDLQNKQLTELPESFLLAGEWCCKWVNGQPVGRVSEVEAEPRLDAQNKPVLPRRSVQVEDKRLPPGWTKHMVRRSVGNSAGKWDVVLVSPQNKRFHTKTDMRHFLEANQDESLKPYENALFDFGVHLKLSRRMGWIQNTPDGVTEAPETILPAGSDMCFSPLFKKKTAVSLKKSKKDKRIPIKIKLHKASNKTYNAQIIDNELAAAANAMDFNEPMPEDQPMPCEDGYVYCGSLKVQVIDTLLRCPAEGCFKNFRNITLLQMHIKHYHRELRKQLGSTPKVLDLAYARTKPTMADQSRDAKNPKARIPKPPKREDIKQEDLYVDVSPTTPKEETIFRTQDSPKLRHALNKPVKRPRVLLPVRRVEAEQAVADSPQNDLENIEPKMEMQTTALPQDFESAISTHTVTKPLDKRKKGEKKKSFAQFSRAVSEDEEWFAMNSDDVDTRSSCPRSSTPVFKMDGKMALMSTDSNEDPQDSNAYTYTETGERIKIVHMKREEIINCHCGFREEDGLMVQCELCLCWQHALCHNIQKEAEVPEKYTCSICLNPRRGRRSKRFLHDQERMYEGVLCGGAACGALRRSHELSGNVLRVRDALHALRVKYYVATKKDHPKLYLWAKDWEAAEITSTQERLNSDYSDLSIMINGIGKENMPVQNDVNMALDLPPDAMDNHELDRYSQRDAQLGSQALLSGLLASPGGASLDLPITASELERLATSVQAAAMADGGEWRACAAPAPAEAAIENSACRDRLLRHIARAHSLIDTRLDSIEAHLAELESQDPSFGEFHETAEFYPRTKQTIQMLMRDLETMEQLGIIT